MSNTAALLNVAERALVQGVPVIPVNADKAPIVPQYIHWRERAQTRDEIHAMPWDRAYGIAAMMWPASPHVALDFDGPHAQLAWDEQAKIPLTPTTKNRTQSGGFHLIFTTDLPLHTVPSNGAGLQRRVRLVEADCECTDKDGSPRPCGVDLIVNGYILIPPSPGYARESGPNLKDALPLPTEVIEFARRQRDPQPTSGLIVRDPGAWLEAALCEETPTGRRTDTAARLAGALIARGLNESLVHSLLLLWLQRVEQPAHDPFTPEDLAQVIEGVSRTHARNHPEDREGLLSATELLAKDFSGQQDIIFGGILPREGGMILAGRSGVGKSIVSIEMALDLAFGNPIFGCFGVPSPQRILVIQTENNEAIVHQRLTAMAKVKGNPGEAIHFRRSMERMDLADERTRQEIGTLIRKAKASVLILDPLSQFHRGNENDNNFMRYILDQVTVVSREAHCASIVVHHFGKPKEGADRDDTRSQIRGASGILDWADTVVSITPKSHESLVLRKIRFEKVRAGEEPRDLIVSRDPETFLSQVRDESTVLCSADKAVEVLRNHGRLASRTDLVKALMDETGASRRTCFYAVENAFKAGRMGDVEEATGGGKWIEVTEQGNPDGPAPF